MACGKKPPILMIIVLMLGLSLSAQSQTSQEEGVVALVNASILFEAADNYEEAQRQMEAAQGLAEDDYLIHLRLGWVYYLNAHYNLAEKSYRRAISLSDGKSIEAMLGLTLPLAAREEWTLVEATYQKILTLDPANFDANLRLGQIYSGREDNDRAGNYFARLLEGYPASYKANLSAGWNFYQLGRKQEAGKCFQRALMLSPSDTSATRGLELLK